MKVLVLGNSRTPEMRPAISCIEQHAAEGVLEQVESIDEAVRLAFRRHWFPDLGIVCQHWPDEFSRSDAERLLSLLPVTRWVCCFGAWCESDGRNRDIWPLSVRVPARCAAPRIRRELAVLADERSALPLTAARDEVFEFDCLDPLPEQQESQKEKGNGRSVLVKSPDFALRESISCLLSAAGYWIPADSKDAASDPASTIRNPQSAIRNLDAVVWDVDPWSDLVLLQLRDFSMQNPGAAIIALAGFAHAEDVQAARSCGADAIVTKLAAPLELVPSLAAAISQKRTSVA